MKHFFSLALAAALSLTAFSSCSNDPTLNGASTTGSNLSFVQLDRAYNPGTNEIFSPWANHDANNRSLPSTDTTGIGVDVSTFMQGPGVNRSAGIAGYAVSNLIIPSILVADLSQSGDASYLGVQSQGLIDFRCAGEPRSGSGLFGGRSVFDDVPTAMLSIAFGNVVPTVSTALKGVYPNVAATAVPDDGKEQNGTGGTPQLTTDNVGCGVKNFNPNQFPYLGNPY